MTLPAVTINDDGCWLTGYVAGSNGYVNLRGRGTAHRVFYEAIVGPVPEGFDLDHLCRNRLCCNPEHLEAVTRRENLARSTNPNFVRHLRGTCDKGHAYAQHAVRDRRGHVAYCRICRNARRRKRVAA